MRRRRTTVSDLFSYFYEAALSELSHIQPNLWHIGEPLEDGEDAVKVIWHSAVCDSIVVHDLDPSQLVVGSIDLSAQNLQRNRDFTDFFLSDHKMDKFTSACNISFNTEVLN